MRDAQCAETNENTILRFLFIELWSILFTIYWWHTLIFKCVTDQTNSFIGGQIYIKDVQCAETNENTIFRFLRFSVSEIWSIL